MTTVPATTWRFATRHPGPLSRLDLLRSTGLRYARRRQQQAARWARLEPNPRTAVYREIWRDAAERVGAEVIELTSRLLELRRDGAVTRVSHQFVMLDDAVTLELAANKTLVHRLLVEGGLPVPEHLEFSPADLSDALAFLEVQPDGCVVKPAAGTGAGWGVTAAVHNPSQLRRATLNAVRYAPHVMIERQVEGDLYRLLFLDGVLLDAVRRRPPTVVGDGHSTVAELIGAENERRIAEHGEGGLWLLRVDFDCLFTLEREGLELESVVPAGKRIAVKTATGENSPDDNETAKDAVSPELVEEAARAAEIVGIRLAGVDAITPDSQSSLRASGGAIVEVNGTPGLSHHRLVADRAAATPVAVPILEQLLAEAATRKRPGPRRATRVST